ncbi:hypothetical protein DY000_02046811 [Brassica cretica]|uniref:Uncharacterized protein n=1 Tax=Brassica cretica TaxID=69181 RepID=A0ABQ7F071_BRACR|nr:hypothetical protein DY000_02046811 [Brassica cretica]
MQLIKDLAETSPFSLSSGSRSTLTLSFQSRAVLKVGGCRPMLKASCRSILKTKSRPMLKSDCRSILRTGSRPMLQFYCRPTLILIQYHIGRSRAVLKVGGCRPMLKASCRSILKTKSRPMLKSDCRSILRTGSRPMLQFYCRPTLILVLQARDLNQL